MPLLNPDGALLRIEVLQLQADRFGNPRPSVETRFANQQLGVFEARKHGGSFIIVEDTVFADGLFPADFHPLHRVRKRTRDDAPLLCPGDDAAHDVPKVDHHVPGRAFSTTRTE